MEWRLLIENEQENGGKKKEKKRKTSTREGGQLLTPLWQRQIYMLARALVGEGWRAKGTPTRIPVGPSRAVEFSTPSMHAPASASPPSRRTPGNSQGPVTRWTRDVCRQLPSRFHPIWPSIHPFGPGVPLSARIIAVMLFGLVAGP